MTTAAPADHDHPDPADNPSRHPLFKSRDRVYPKAVQGRYRRLKSAALAILLGLYYLVPWLRWDRGPDAPGQAVLIDLPGRRAYFFDIEIWPQEIYYITGLLILCAIGLFLATALFGRIWCGYACPQTVWTDLFMAIERWIEGDRGDRIRLDKGPWTLRKIGRKLAKHSAWLFVSFLTGGAWVLYCYDAPTYVHDLAFGQLTAGAALFTGLLTASAYLLGGIAREQVCTYMCPWPRFQSAMIDEDSVIVTYEDWRGEGRGPLKRSEPWEARRARGGGDCIDCKHCIHVCPTGIDIRDGQQLECIGCGLCIDACNEIMTKIGRPGDLITFDTLNNQVACSAGKPPVKPRLLRPRTIFYLLVLIVVGGLMAGSLALRPKLDITVIRDRAPLYVTLTNGDIRNGYAIKIVNMTRAERRFRLTLDGLPAPRLDVVGGHDEPGAAALVLSARPDTVTTYRVLVQAPPTATPQASTDVTFILADIDGGESATRHSVFRAPGR